MKKSILIVVCVLFITGFSRQPCTANNDQEREITYRKGLDIIAEFYQPASPKSLQSKLEDYFDIAKIKSKIEILQSEGLSTDAQNQKLSDDLKTFIFKELDDGLAQMLNTYKIKTPVKPKISIIRPVTIGLATSTMTAAIISSVLGASAALTATAPSLWSAVGAYWTCSSLGAAAAATSVVSGWGLIAVGATVVGAGVAYICGQKELDQQLREARSAIAHEIIALRPIIEKAWFDLIKLK